MEDLPDQSTQLYRIAQETVTNAVRHAGATRISIELAEDDGGTTLRVFDDGIGIPDATASDGLGLRIMRHRAASIGAHFSIERDPNGGTAVVCTLRRPPAPSVLTPSS